MIGSRFVRLLMLAASLAASDADALASDPGCAAQVLAQSGVRAAAELSCHAMAADGGEADAHCLARAEGRWESRLRHDCVGDAERVALAATIQGFVVATTALVGPDTGPDLRACRQAKLRAAAAGARGLLGCHAQSVRRRAPAGGGCLVTAGRRLEQRWHRAEAKGPCGDTNDAATVATELADFAGALLRTVTPSPAALVGTYDTAFAFDPRYFDPLPGSGEVLGVLRETGDGTVWLDIELSALESLGLGGSIEPWGGVTLDGHFVMGGDILYQAKGTLTVSDRGDERRVTGRVEAALFDGRVVAVITFTMVRPVSGTPAAFSGSYAFVFAPSPDGLGSDSSAAIMIDVPPSGIGMASSATDFDANGTPRGTFAGGECLVSPQGRLRYRTSYDPVDPASPASHCWDPGNPACPVALGGRLAFHGLGVGGNGAYVRGLTPFVFGGGTWVATQ